MLSTANWSLSVRQASVALNPAFAPQASPGPEEDTWIECLGDIARVWMAIHFGLTQVEYGRVMRFTPSVE